MSAIFAALLIFAGIAGTIIGLGMASQATAGVAIIAASACALILARIVQADANHHKLMKVLKTITDHVE